MGIETVTKAYQESQEMKKLLENLSESDVLDLKGACFIQKKYLNLCKKIIIEDLQFALRNKVEQDVWNFCFKNFISILQKMSKNEKCINRPAAQSRFNNAIYEANGFYFAMLENFCNLCDLKVPFRRDYSRGIEKKSYTKQHVDEDFKSLCYFICTHSLIHLGDLDRYRNHISGAELYYRHALSTSPTNGHAYNQLALLDVIRTNELGTVFYYARAIMCQHQFSPSISNLMRTLENVPDSNITDPYAHLELDKLINVFLHFHKILHTNRDTWKCSMLVKVLNTRMIASVGTNCLSGSILLQMFIINLFSINYLGLCPENIDCESKLSAKQQEAKDDILRLIVGQLDAMLLTSSTIVKSLISNDALPTIKLCFEWVLTRTSILNEPAFSENSKIWKKFCIILNKLQNLMPDFECSSVPVGCPLPEDNEVLGFLPLADCLKNLNFTESNNSQKFDSKIQEELRATRLVELGHIFTSLRVNDAPLIEYVKDNSGGRFIVYNDEVEAAEYINEPMKSSQVKKIEELLRRPLERTLVIGNPNKMKPNQPDSDNRNIHPTSRSSKNAAIHSILKLQKLNQINETSRDEDSTLGPMLNNFDKAP